MGVILRGRSPENPWRRRRPSKGEFQSDPQHSLPTDPPPKRVKVQTPREGKHREAGKGARVWKGRGEEHQISTTRGGESRVSKVTARKSCRMAGATPEMGT